MANALSGLFLMAILLVSGMIFAQTAFSAVDDVTQSWKEMEASNHESVQTGINVIDAQVAGGAVEVYVKNTGATSITQFSEWDVVSHFYDVNDAYYIQRLAHSDGPGYGSNEWIVDMIYASDSLTQPEAYEPGIINPGEVALLELGLSPEPGPTSINWVIVSTANGTKASAQFEGQEI